LSFVKRAGLLATNSIREGQNREVLLRIKATGDIFMAWSDRNWFLDGAVVRVSIIGFDDGREAEKTLNGEMVKKINIDLTSDIDLSLAKTLDENQDLSFEGLKKTGQFELSGELAKTMLNIGGNPNNRPNSDVVKPSFNGVDLVRRSRNVWIVDFGVDTPLEQACQYELPFEYIRENVKPFRERSKERKLKQNWWLLARPRPAMRVSVKGLKRFIVTPKTAKYRLFAWIEPPTLPDQAVYVIARQDDYFFGVLHSRIHELWTRRKGTQLRDAESGSRYTSTETFQTFPFPWTPGKEPIDDPRVQAIAEAAQELNENRERWLNPEGISEKELKKRTLTNLYNQRPTWLDLAHQKLDQAVLDAYGWLHGISDEEILEKLLELNLERSGSN